MFKKLKQKILGAGAAVAAFMGWFFCGCPAYALEINVDSALHTGSGSGLGALDSLNNTIGSLGQAGIKTSRIIAVFLFVIGLIIAFIIFFFSDANKRQEAKGDLIAKCLGVVGAFAAIAIVTLLAGIGDGVK